MSSNMDNVQPPHTRKVAPDYKWVYKLTHTVTNDEARGTSTMTRTYELCKVPEGTHVPISVVTITVNPRGTTRM